MRSVGFFLLLFFAADRSAVAAGDGWQVTDNENPPPPAAPETAHEDPADPSLANGARPSQQQQSPQDSPAPQVLAGVVLSAVGLGLVGYFEHLGATGSSGW